MQYGDRTWQIFSALTHRNLQIAEENGQLILRISEQDFDLQMQKYGQILDRLLEEARRPHEKKKELAQRLQVDKTILSAALSDKTPRKLKRDIILSVLFLIRPLPTVDQVNHKLMELMQPGLFTETAFIAENQRNWVLYHIFEYGQDHNCPAESWLEYANAALHYFEMQPLIPGECRLILSPEQTQMLDQWSSAIESVGTCDFSVMRNDALKEYRYRHGLDTHSGKQEAVRRLAEQTQISQASVESIFGRMTNKNSNVHPDTLIPVLAAMGCTLRQVNKMLMQANRALVYYSSRSEYDLRWIRVLMQNTEAEKNS